ncbi:MAG: hypothetical protein ACLUHG_03415 [Sutterella wadsworthensis]
MRLPRTCPAVTDTAVYAAGESRVVRLDRQTGNVWRAETDGRLRPA